MTKILDILRREPAVVRNLLLAVFALATVFGFELTDETVGVVFAIFAAVTGIDVRRKVTPVATLEAAAD